MPHKQQQQAQEDSQESDNVVDKVWTTGEQVRLKSAMPLMLRCRCRDQIRGCESSTRDRGPLA